MENIPPQLADHPALAGLDQRARAELLEQARLAYFSRGRMGWRHLQPFALLLATFVAVVLLPLGLWTLLNPVAPPWLDIVILGMLPAAAIILSWRLQRQRYHRGLLAEIELMRSAEGKR